MQCACVHIAKDSNSFHSTDGEWDWDNYEITPIAQKKNLPVTAMVAVKYNIWCAIGNCVHVVHSHHLRNEVTTPTLANSTLHTRTCFVCVHVHIHVHVHVHIHVHVHVVSLFYFCILYMYIGMCMHDLHIQCMIFIASSDCLPL